MIYEYVIDVPANTLKTDPVEIEALLAAGIITRFECEMAAGCHRMVHAVVLDGTFQMFPVNLESDLSTDDNIIEQNDYIEVAKGHDKLKIVCWSPNTDYTHRVTIRFVIQDKKAAGLPYLVDQITKLDKSMKKLVTVFTAWFSQE